MSCSNLYFKPSKVSIEAGTSISSGPSQVLEMSGPLNFSVANDSFDYLYGTIKYVFSFYGEGNETAGSSILTISGLSDNNRKIRLYNFQNKTSDKITFYKIYRSLDNGDTYHLLKTVKYSPSLEYLDFDSRNNYESDSTYLLSGTLFDNNGDEVLPPTIPSYEILSTEDDIIENGIYLYTAILETEYGETFYKTTENITIEDGKKLVNLTNNYYNSVAEISEDEANQYYKIQNSIKKINIYRSKKNESDLYLVKQITDFEYEREERRNKDNFYASETQYDYVNDSIFLTSPSWYSGETWPKPAPIENTTGYYFYIIEYEYAPFGKTPSSDVNEQTKVINDDGGNAGINFVKITPNSPLLQGGEIYPYIPDNHINFYRTLVDADVSDPNTKYYEISPSDEGSYYKDETSDLDLSTEYTGYCISSMYEKILGQVEGWFVYKGSIPNDLILYVKLLANDNLLDVTISSSATSSTGLSKINKPNNITVEESNEETLPNGEYKYKFSYETRYGSTETCDETPIENTTGCGIKINIPSNIHDSIVGIKVYRTKANESTYYFVGRINRKYYSGSYYIDNKEDSELVVGTPDESNSTGKYKYRTCFFAGTDGSPIKYEEDHDYFITDSNTYSLGLRSGGLYYSSNDVDPFWSILTKVAIYRTKCDGDTYYKIDETSEIEEIINTDSFNEDDWYSTYVLQLETIDTVSDNSLTEEFDGISIICFEDFLDNCYDYLNNGSYDLTKYERNYDSYPVNINYSSVYDVLGTSYTFIISSTDDYFSSIGTYRNTVTGETGTVYAKLEDQTTSIEFTLDEDGYSASARKSIVAHRDQTDQFSITCDCVGVINCVGVITGPIGSREALCLYYGETTTIGDYEYDIHMEILYVLYDKETEQPTGNWYLWRDEIINRHSMGVLG